MVARPEDETDHETDLWDVVKTIEVGIPKGVTDDHGTACECRFGGFIDRLEQCKSTVKCRAVVSLCSRTCIVFEIHV